MTINDSIYGLARLLTQVSLGLLGCENEGNSWLVSAVLDYADSNNWPSDRGTCAIPKYMYPETF